MGANPADWAGQHALALFFTLLALLLALTCTGWLITRRVGAHWAQRASRSQWAIRPGILGAGLVTLLGACVFFWLSRQLEAGSALTRADQAFTNALRTSVTPWTHHVFAALTHLADPFTLTVLCIAVALALLAARQRVFALGWLLALAGNGLLNQNLKQTFDRIRPLNSDGSTLAAGWSFPSGHSSGAVVAYGMLAYLALRLLPPRWQLPALLGAVALAFAVGASRVFLRVHFASDVIAGFASGAAWLGLCVTGMELIAWGRTRR